MLKKKISQEEFVELLLKIRKEIEALAIKIFNKEFEYSVYRHELKFEMMIFSLWIVTLCIPPNDSEIKDMLHSGFSKEYLGTKKDELLFRYIDERYRKYYEAFNLWTRNHENGHMIGTVMIEIIKNQNTDFSLSKKIPLVGAMESLKAFILFSELFELTLKMIKKIKEEMEYKEALFEKVTWKGYLIILIGTLILLFWILNIIN